MTALTLVLAYIAIFFVAYWGVTLLSWLSAKRADFNSLKTVTFGDESAVRPNRAASIISIIAIFLIWGAFTGSAITPIHVPGPFIGDTSFTYTARTPDGATDEAKVTVRVHEVGAEVADPEAAPSEGFATSDVATVGAWRSTLVRVRGNDEGGDADGYDIVAVDGQPISPGESVSVADGTVSMTRRGTLSFEPDKG
ncbi:MAG: ABC transporter permease, partial [Pseudomonadota bacterium]